MRVIYIVLAVMACSFMVKAQDDIPEKDTTRILEEVVVKAYRSDRPLSEVAATVNVVGERELNRFSPVSLVTATNTVPGVRMEERSPGSYRFSIRGSLLRSPFGVRNVKFYWKGLPFTDGGGNTYLNLLDFSSIGKMEIIKGPGASLYGAGTGGVVLLDAPEDTKPLFNVHYVGGSFGTRRYGANTWAQLGRRHNLQFAANFQNSDGYREQTKMGRSNVRGAWNYAINNKNNLSINFLAASLNYQTPGGLNAAQFETDPRQARPATQTASGAVSQDAHIENVTYYYGASYTRYWSRRWTTNFGLFTSSTDFKNPAILNYEIRQEDNSGGRTETQYIFGGDEQKGKIIFGGEFQFFKSPLKVYDNNGGVAGNLRTSDILQSRSYFAFAQAEFELPYQFLLTAGGSANFLKYDFERTSVTPSVVQERDFKPGFFPRVAINKKFTKSFSAYGSVSEGFSAPSLAEVRPSTGNFNDGLNPEKGRNIELGIRTELFERQLRLNVVAYDFKLRETIVVQAAANGADFFINAGTTSQRGIESTISWTPWATVREDKDHLKIWASYTYNNFRFLDYVTNSNDFSRNKLTGVPANVIVAGIDASLPQGWYTNIVFNSTAQIPLNDANTEFASKYTLIGARIGRKADIWRYNMIDLFIGVDNALDEKYSLGNDLNAAAGRYYNAAPGRNFYFGINLPLLTGQ
jgi:iron complex outermembrane recepter protein